MVENRDEDGMSDDIAYSVEPGVFKKFCEKAHSPVAKQTMEGMGINSAPTVWKVSLQGAGDNPTRTECMDKDHIRIGWDDWGENPTDEMVQKAPAVNNIINRMQIGDIVFSLYNATTIDAIGIVDGEYEWHDEYDHFKRLRPVKWIVKGIREDIVALNGGKRMTQLPIHQLKVSADDAMAIAAKHLPELKQGQSKKSNYVFIIDEINRGNISKIFGELITLIEPSKRIGQIEGATAKLPYSQMPFGVPNNVYLIGTMNTADRSIATIDTALRRRFQFREMPPDPTVLDGISVEDISIKDLLERMNKKIAVLYDREHTIGHGYFTSLRDDASIENLADIFENKILPLLQEYFYDDYEKIRLVLGDNNKTDAEEQFVIATPVDFTDLFGNADLNMDDAVSYEINKAAFDNIDAYRSI